MKEKWLHNFEVQKTQKVKETTTEVNEAGEELQITKEVEKKLVEDALYVMREKFKDKMRNVTNTLANDYDKKYRQSFVDMAKRELMASLTPKEIKKEFKREDWKELYDSVVEPTLVNFLENMLNEWCVIDINIGSKKKKANIQVVGTDSYEYRKK